MGGKLTQDDFIKRIEANYGTEYEVLTPYTKAHEKVKVRHSICGYKWEVDPWSLLRKQIKQCPKCSNKWKRDTDSFKKEVAELYNGEYEVIGEYVSTNILIHMKHTICGHEFMRTPCAFKQGVRCPICRRPNYNETTATFSSRLLEKHGGKYTMLTEYKNAKSLISVRCNKCHQVWDCTPDNLMRGHGCPHYVTSRGEASIERWLIANGLKYKPQYSNRECRDKRALRFDFAIFLPGSDTPALLIEYDGVQHFRATRFCSDMTNTECEKNLSDVKRKDEIKENFCKEKRIPLLRIHYKDFDKIDKILEDNLRKTIPCQAG